MDKEALDLSARNSLSLPIDQRYSLGDMDRIVNALLSFTAKEDAKVEVGSE